MAYLPTRCLRHYRPRDQLTDDDVDDYICMVYALLHIHASLEHALLSFWYGNAYDA